MPDQGVSTGNSTHAPLGANGVFTGVWEQVPYLTSVTVMAFSNVASASGGFQLQWSNDPNVDPTIATGIAEYAISQDTVFGVAGGSIARYQSRRLAEWFRVVYTNGPGAQTQFDLETIYDDDGSVSPESVSTLNVISPLSAELTGFRSVASGKLKESIGREPTAGMNTGSAAEAVVIMGADATGAVWRSALMDTSGRLQVTNTPSGSTAVKGEDESGSITFTAANQALTFQSIGPCVLSYSISTAGPWNGTFRVELSTDGGATYFQTESYQTSGSQNSFINFTASLGTNLLAVAYIPANSLFRIRCLTFVAGTATVNAVASYGRGHRTLGYSIDPSGNVVPLGNDGNGNLLVNFRVASISASTAVYQGTEDDNNGATAAGGLIVNARAIAYNGVGITRIRTPRQFLTVAAATAGNTALWTPTAGKKFRLMRYQIHVTGNASFAVAGVLTISLFDAAAGATGQVHDVYIPAIAGIVTGEAYTSPWIDLGNGYLSVLVNNVLNVNLSAALATGNVRVLCCGTEE